MSRKDIGNHGENVVTEYLRRLGFIIKDRNIVRKTGEIDIIAEKDDTLHFVEVKTLVCVDFPRFGNTIESYDPSENLHSYKVKKVVRTSEWYMSDIAWEGDSQVDGALVWLRERDGVAYVRYLPQIL